MQYIRSLGPRGAVGEARVGAVYIRGRYPVTTRRRC